MNSHSYTTDQWIRRWSLVVSDESGGQALVISEGDGTPGAEQLRFLFEVNLMVLPNVNKATIRVYNPKNETVQKVVREFRHVTLAAGYRTGRFATIFDGSIVQYKYGGETPVDKFLEITAFDADVAYNYSTINKTLMPPANTVEDQEKAIATATGLTRPDHSGYTLAAPPQPRPVVLNGMASDEAAVIAKSSVVTVGGQRYQGRIWSVQQGKLVLIPAVGAPVTGEEAVINAATGMVGFPTATNDGIEIRTLLNPSLHIAQRVRLNNDEINKIAAGRFGSSAGPGIGQGVMATEPFFFATTSDDGTYMIVALRFRGDTRGQDWYTDMVCLALDRSSSVATAVDEIVPGLGG